MEIKRKYRRLTKRLNRVLGRLATIKRKAEKLEIIANGMIHEISEIYPVIKKKAVTKWK